MVRWFLNALNLADWLIGKFPHAQEHCAAKLRLIMQLYLQRNKLQILFRMSFLHMCSILILFHRSTQSSLLEQVLFQSLLAQCSSSDKQLTLVETL